MVFLYSFLCPVATTTLVLLSELLRWELDSDEIEDVRPLLELVVDHYPCRTRLAHRTCDALDAPHFSGAHGWAEVLHNPAFSGVPIKGDKIKSGYINPAFSGAHEWAELLRNPCVLGDPHQRGQEWPSLGQW